MCVTIGRRPRSLDDCFTDARDVAKLDFVIVTDHDFGKGPPWRMPKEEWELNGISRFSELAPFSPGTCARKNRALVPGLNVLKSRNSIWPRKRPTSLP